MEIIDISKDLMKTPVYPGDPEGYVDSIKSLKNGDNCNLNSVYTCLHTATHIDAPLHFLEGGDSIDKFSPEIFIGECQVVEAPPGPITGAFAEENFPWQECERLLIKGNGLAYFMESSAYYVVDSGVKLLGIDAQSISMSSQNQAVHRAILSANVPILEGLDLTNVEPGKYFLVAQPLKISGVEASPCRAVLVKDYLFWTGTRTDV